MGYRYSFRCLIFLHQENMSIQSTDFCSIEYHHLGEVLTEKHIGKSVIRVVPHRNDTSNCYVEGTSIEETALRNRKFKPPNLLSPRRK